MDINFVVKELSFGRCGSDSQNNVVSQLWVWGVGNFIFLASALEGWPSHLLFPATVCGKCTRNWIGYWCRWSRNPKPDFYPGRDLNPRPWLKTVQHTNQKTIDHNRDKKSYIKSTVSSSLNNCSWLDICYVTVNKMCWLCSQLFMEVGLMALWVHFICHHFGLNAFQ